MAVTFQKPGDDNRWWEIGQKLGYTGQRDGSGGLGKFLDSTGQRAAAENYFTSGKMPEATGGRPLGVVEPFSDWTKQGLSNLAAGAPTTGDMQFARESLQGASNALKGNAYSFDASPYVSKAMQASNFDVNPYLQASRQAFNPQTAAQAYMNPYQASVMEAFNAEADRARAKQQSDINATFAQGAFGSARQGVREAEADRDINQLKLNNAANLMFQGYTNSLANAMSQNNAERARDLQAGGLGLQAAGQQASKALSACNFAQSDAMNRFNAPIAQAQALAGLASPSVSLRNSYLDQWRQGQQDLLGAGNQVQAQNQRELDAYNAQRLGLAGWDRSSVDWYGGALGRFPSGQTQTPYQPNWLQTAGSLAMLGAGYLQSQNQQTNLGSQMPWLYNNSTPNPYLY